MEKQQLAEAVQKLFMGSAEERKYMEEQFDIQGKSNFFQMSRERKLGGSLE